MRRSDVLAALVVLTFPAVLAACDGPPRRLGDPPASVDLVRTWRSADVPGCALASPLLVTSQGQELLLTAYSDGVLIGTSLTDGSEVFRVALAAPAGQAVHIAATPGVLGSRVVVATMLRDAASARRLAHQVVVLDLETRALDPRFPALTLAASLPAEDGGVVDFSPANAYSRAAIPTTHPADMTYGLAYVAYGNIQDIQPWHGWLFEIDLDAWAAGGTAVSGTFLATPERDCGPPGESGSDGMICGGGVWSPPGPTLVERTDGTFEIFVPTGNGQLDLGRHDYANSVARLGRGLAFAPTCDAAACASFDPIDPSRACMESCRDLFIPRLLPGDPPFAAPGGRCDGKTFFECYAILDWDLGANSVARVAVPGGADVLVIPAKDGGVYLADADHLGTLHDRIQLTEICGAHGGNCTANWAGSMVTGPAVTSVAGVPTVVIPTFLFDSTNPAGMVALQIVRDSAGIPKWRKLWEAPEFGSDESIERFREHVGRVAIVTLAGVEYAALVDPGAEHSKDGLLYLVRVADGTIEERAALDGPGRKYTLPVAANDTLFTVSCDAEVGPSHLEAWKATSATSGK
jgi:hypothetical protein